MTIYTTRTIKVAASLTRRDILNLGAMSRQDAVEFFEKSVREDLLHEEAVAMELLNELA